MNLKQEALLAADACYVWLLPFFLTPPVATHLSLSQEAQQARHQDTN